MKVYEPTPGMLMDWLRESDETRLQQLWYMANATRQRNVGDEVYLRALVEFSNRCSRRCTYCGLRSENRVVQRYSLTSGEVLAAARHAAEQGCGTLVLQAGEDWNLDFDWFLDLLRSIRRDTDIAITVSIGELSQDKLVALKDAGADRYLLRFETSNPELFSAIHPAADSSQRGRSRISMLRDLRMLGFEVGSGIMVGIPGQKFEDLVSDLLLMKELDLDMIGIGPYVPHPDTPLGAAVCRGEIALPPYDSELTSYKMIALVRMLLPRANIPSTTALATVNRSKGRILGLERGANIVMPNFTPKCYRESYSIYPEKAGTGQSADDSLAAARASIDAAGRRVGVGRGASVSFLERRGEQP